MSSASMWDARYGGAPHVYGTEPNDFLKTWAHRLPPRGRVLSLAEGEGRNAVFLAGLGHVVTAVDQSAVGLEKARRFAAARGVTLETVVADLTDYVVAPKAWDGVVSIFCHVPPAVRCRLHAGVLAGLRPGGVFLLEAYRPAQLQYKTGGPPTADLLPSLDELRTELSGLEFFHAVETERDVVEGSLHTGRAAVVQLVAVKPFPPPARP